MKFHLCLICCLMMCSCTAINPIPMQESDMPEKTEPVADNSAGTEGSIQIEIENPYAAQAGDDDMIIGKAFLEITTWDAETGTLQLTGSLPTPCNQLRVKTVHENENLIINVFSVYPADTLCAQVLEPFEAILSINDLPKGIKNLLINEQAIKNN